MWVSPFRDLRINGYLLLPAAFRSLSRLSSALSAKASTLRSFLLDLSRDLSQANRSSYIALYEAHGSFCFSRMSCDDNSVLIIRHSRTFGPLVPYILRIYVPYVIHALRPASGPPCIPDICRMLSSLSSDIFVCMQFSRCGLRLPS